MLWDAVHTLPVSGFHAYDLRNHPTTALNTEETVRFRFFICFIFLFALVNNYTCLQYTKDCVLNTLNEPKCL